MGVGFLPRLDKAMQQSLRLAAVDGKRRRHGERGKRLGGDEAVRVRVGFKEKASHVPFQMGEYVHGARQHFYKARGNVPLV